ncbi:MAG: hypothetical protein LBN98_01765 [Prevotellaceae bacterium]|jgi:hypothetical protein|nr:hypothetical protein [Prevotellaceae bacterium]
MANNILTYTINLNGNVTKGVLDISGAAQKATGAMDKLHARANKIANIGFAFQHTMAVIGKFTAAMDKCVKAYEMQSVAEKKLETLMRNSMSATGAQIQGIKDLTAAQQKLGVIGDEIQLAGAQELSTYLTKTESLRQLIPAMNDMLAQQYGLNASQEQAVTIAQMMGKVLDGQVGALSRYGYRFDEAQEKVLQYGNEQQRVAMLSGILTQYVGGVNAALSATPEGKWKQHQNAMGDLQERIGGLIVSVRGALMPAFEAVGNFVQRLTAFFEAHKQSIMGVAETVGNILSGALSLLGGVIAFTVEHWKAFTAAIVAWKVVALLSMSHFAKLRLLAMAHTKALSLCTGATNLFSRATKMLKLAFDALSRHPWLIAITAAIGLTIALAGAFRKFNQAQQAAEKAVNNVAAKIGVEQQGLNRLFEAMKKTNPESERRKTLIDQLNAKYPGLLKNQDLLKGSIEDIAKAQQDANKALAQNIFLQDFQEKHAAIISKINAAQEDVWKSYGTEYEGALKEAMDKLEAFVKPLASENKNHYLNYYDLIPVFKNTSFYSAEKTRHIDTKWLDLATTMYDNYKIENQLRRFGMGRYGITEDMISGVNAGLVPGGSGGTNPLGGTTAAIATGGTRNTTVNIHLGKMQAAEHIHYSGGVGENTDNALRTIAEQMYKVLGVAETAV